MKLSRLTVQDFLGISEAAIDFHSTTYIFGDNGSGKSSIAEGIRFALTRTARGTDAAGRGAGQLVKDGASKAAIKLAFADGEGIAVEIAGSSVSLAAGGRFAGKAAESYLADTLGPPELLRCLTDAGRVLEMSAKEQSELLQVVFGEGSTLGELDAHARAAGLSSNAHEMILAAVGDRLGAGKGVTPAILADCYQSAYAKRRDAKAELDKLKKAPVAAPLVDAPIPSDEEIAAAREALEQIENEGFDLRTRNGIALEAARAQGRLIEEEKRLRARLDALPKPEAGDAVQLELGAGPTVEQLAAALVDAEAAEEAARINCDSARAAHVAATSHEALLRGQAEGKATACDGTIARGSVCPLAPKPEPVSGAKLSAAQKRLGDAMNADRRAKTDLADAIQSTEAARSALTAAKEAAARSAGATEAQRTALEEQLQQLAIQIEAAGDTTSIVSQLDEALLANARTKAEAQRLVEAKVYVGEQRKAWDSYAAKLSAAQSEVDLFKELCEALEPRALPARLLAQRIGPFVEQVNATLVQIAPFTIAIEAEDGLSLRVIPEAGGKPRSPALLSESERLRVGAALSLALAKVSGLGFCLIDRFDALTPANRAKFAETVSALGLESVIVLGSYEDPPFEADATCGVYWVEGGVANSVEQPQEVLN